MKLYSIQYQVKSTGQIFICLSIGRDQNDIINDLVSIVDGSITVLSLYSVTEVHRISGSIRRQIVERSISKKSTVKKVGRPRKYDKEEE